MVNKFDVIKIYFSRSPYMYKQFAKKFIKGFENSILFLLLYLFSFIWVLQFYYDILTIRART